MKTMLSIFALVSIVGCKTSTDSTSTNNTNGNNPPTTSYFKIDGTASGSSADAASVARVGGVTKPFTFSDGTHLNGALQITFHNTNFSSLSGDVAEGGSRTLYITRYNYSDSHDSVQVVLETDNYPKGIYELIASSGRLFLTKKNDTLRVTSDGVLTVTGKNTLPPYESQTRTTEFSIRDRVSF
jgi:hypothetical protein